MDEAGTPGLTRRALLRGAGGAGLALAASAAPPGWARALAAAGGRRHPGSRPFSDHPVGFESMREIEHIVVVMMENHSFDNFLGMLPHRVEARRNVDGFKVGANGLPTAWNHDRAGNRVYAHHAGSPCQLEGKPTQAWNPSHIAWDHGRNDGFVRASGNVAMWYWEKSDLPFTYSLVKHFPVGQRYFQSVLGQTYPNRRFLFSGTASGTIATNSLTFSIPAANGTVFDRLDDVGVSWKDYYEDLPSPLIIPGAGDGRAANFVKGLHAFVADARAGKLPAVSYVEPDYATTSQEDPQDIQVGEDFLHDIVHALIESPHWGKTALFITYDEHGGYYDHVPPPPAIEPDSIPPRLAPGDIPGGYDRYGFRVPLIVVSPWARPDYVSSRVQDHTSILAFIERKWNLPAMTFRDANADPMIDYFDFKRPAFREPPKLEASPPLEVGLKKCAKHDLSPPLPESAPRSLATEGIGARRQQRELARRARALTVA